MSPSGRPVQDAYRSLGIVTYPLPGDEELVFSEHGGAARVMASVDVDILTACRAFRALQDHAHDVCEAGDLPPEKAAGVLYQLTQYAKAGLLVSRRGVLGAAEAAPPVPPPPPIGVLGVVTRDRPDALARGLESYVENAAKHDRRVRVAVMDDSSDPSVRARNRAALAALKARFGGTAAYAGPEEKRRFRDALVREGADPEVVDFALFDPEGCGYAPGANRNALLLDTIGELVLGVDDDTVCRTADPPAGAAAGLSLSSDGDPTVTWWYPDRDAATRAVRFADRDVLGAHAEWLGRGIGEALARAGDAADLDAMDARFLRLIRAGGGRVRVTQCGLVGDCALGSIVWLTTVRGPSLRRLSSEADYRLAASTREVFRAAPRVTLSNQPFLMTFGAGFDHREPLPPFVPVMRFEDGLFGMVLRKCLDHACLAHLPFGVLHAPVEPRSFAGQDMGREARSFQHDVMGACLSSMEPGTAKPEGAERFRALGRHLAELGALPPRDFDEFVRRTMWSEKAGWLDDLERTAAEHATEAPAWAADLRRYAAELKGSLAGEKFTAPADLERGRSADEARALSRRLAGRYGRLLEAWADVREAARRLREKGTTLSTSL